MFVSFVLTVNVLVEMDAEGMAKMFASLKNKYFREIASTVDVGDVSWFLKNMKLILNGYRTC